MTQEKKIRLAELIIDFLKEAEETKNIPVYIGVLTKTFGLNGFKKAEIGSPVFEYNDRYIIYLETLDGKTSVEVPFYKKDLSVQLKDAYDTR